MWYVIKRETDNMIRIVLAIIQLLISVLCVVLYLIGSHGHLMFRPHMTEDWIIWGVALSTLLTGIYLLTRKTRGVK